MNKADRLSALNILRVNLAETYTTLQAGDTATTAKRLEALYGCVERLAEAERAPRGATTLGAVSELHEKSRALKRLSKRKLSDAHASRKTWSPEAEAMWDLAKQLTLR